MRYVILVGDGMADHPLPELRGRTPLEVARTPNMDTAARGGAGGRVRTIPRDMPPGSDVANLSILGVNPRKSYTGRGPLEAASKGVALAESDWAFRCNLVTVSEGMMTDYSGGHVSSEEAAVLIGLLADKFREREVRLIPGVSYRNLMVVNEEKLTGGHGPLYCVPPHDITGKPIHPNLPRGRGSRLLREMMEASLLLLGDHPINRVKIDLGENPANMIWIWGGGKKPAIDSFESIHRVTGAVISAVDLVKGIGNALGLEVIDVPGATGYYDTDYEAKARAALDALERHDFVLVHVEAADEAGHNGDRSEKVRAIENFDAKIVGPILEGLAKAGPFRLMILPDHATPLAVRTHVSDPVPFCFCGKGIEADGMEAFSERAALKGSIKLSEGWKLISKLLIHAPAKREHE